MKIIHGERFVWALLPFFTILTACSEDAKDKSESDGGTDNAVPGVYTIYTSGGVGGSNNGGGGSGGAVSFYKPGGLGAVEVLGSGAVDASFLPTEGLPTLGSNPLSITADSTIGVVGSADAEPASGTPYMVLTQPYIYISDGDGLVGEAAEQVTGLSVAEGATLTLPLNRTSYAHITLTDDVENRGVISTMDYSLARRGGLKIEASFYYGSGAIDTSGQEDGQAGGYVELIAANSVFNTGVIDTGGGDGVSGAGGDGGYLTMSALSRIENTAEIVTKGGQSASAEGGNGGAVDLSAHYGLLNSGSFDSSGGSGDSSGGHGGGHSLSVIHHGDLKNSGNLTASGGRTVQGPGGNGGYIDLSANGGAVYTSGNLISKGGATESTGSDGGSGGDIYIANGYQDNGTPDYADDIPATDILVSGNIDTSGGATSSDGSAYGGNGGVFDIWLDAYDHPEQQRLALLGYTGINTRGGDGNFGGNGGSIELWNDTGYDAATVRYTPSGNVTNEVNIIASGGNVVANAMVAPANGGNGGAVALSTDDAYGSDNPDGEKLVNKGAIDASGGSNWNATDKTAGGMGGMIDLWGYNGLSNEGALTANGGADSGADGGTDGIGSDGGAILLGANSAPVVNKGAISASGGDGEYVGGDGAMVFLGGASVENYANITAKGGNARVTLASSLGGDGGIVWFYVPLDSLTQEGTVSHTAGDGVTPGVPGEMIISSSGS